MIPNIRTNHCPHCKAQAGVIKAQAGVINAQAEVMAALRADNARLREEIVRLRGPVMTYKKGYGPGDSEAALQETSDGQ